MVIDQSLFVEWHNDTDTNLSFSQIFKWLIYRTVVIKLYDVTQTSYSISTVSEVSYQREHRSKTTFRRQTQITLINIDIN